jgi:hypothetical protein
MVKARVFVDAKVLFAMAHRPKGFLSGLLLQGALHLISSDYAFQEAAENLAAFNAPALSDLRELEQHITITDRISPLPPWVTLDPEDRQILAAAIGSECDHLISYNHDFDSVFGQTIGGVKVEHASVFVRRLSE